MELGLAEIRRVGINSLLSAVHTKHGLIWSDGKVLFLNSVSVKHSQVQSENPTTLGEFERIESVSWSCHTSDSDFCFLSLVHSSAVTIWKVDGTVPDLNFKQIRKINTRIIPQGCLWNPNKDIVCLLSKQQCSFYFQHLQNKGSYSFPPLESGIISCGCWSEDGQKLVIGLGSIILVYRFIDINRAISQYEIVAWKIPNVDGRIRCLSRISGANLACTVELPLEDLCKTTGYEPPDNKFDPECSMYEDQDSDYEYIKPGMKPGADTTNKYSLFNLQANSKAPKIDSSQVIVFEVEEGMHEPHKISSQGLKGILAPDLLYCNQNGIIVVGSNTQNLIQVFKLDGSCLIKHHDILLSRDERPKGICGVPSSSNQYYESHGALILVGSQKDNGSPFLPPSSYQQYSLALRFYFTSPDIPELANSRVSPDMKPNIVKDVEGSYGANKLSLLKMNSLKQDNIPCSSNLEDTNPSTMSHSRSNSSGSSSPKLVNLVIPGSNSNTSTQSSRNKIVMLGSNKFEDKDLETDTMSFYDKNVGFRSKVKDFLENRSNIGLQNGDNLSFGSRFGGYNVSRESVDYSLQIETLESQLLFQANQISALQSKVEDLTKLVESSLSEKTAPQSTEPEILQLIFKRRGLEIKKAFLLHRGQLLLQSVKEAFCLETVELMIHDVPCILGATPEGYIPMTFKAGDCMEIQGTETHSTC